MKVLSDALPSTFTTETALAQGVHPRDLYALARRRAARGVDARGVPPCGCAASFVSGCAGCVVSVIRTRMLCVGGGCPRADR